MSDCKPASGVGGGRAGGGDRHIISDVPPHIQQLLEQQDHQAFKEGSPSRRPVYPVTGKLLAYLPQKVFPLHIILFLRISGGPQRHIQKTE